MILPDAPLYNLMAMLVHLYLPHPLVLELELVLAEGEAPPFVMDDPLFRLDYTIFLFDDVMPETSVRFPLEAPPVENPRHAPDFGSLPEGAPGPRLVEYYKKELALLRDLANAFAKSHPEMAPLVSGPMADASVERVLEGIAFLCALLKMKLDDDLPEIIHEVMRNTQPHHLCPVPATTIITFMPKQNCTETHIIPPGTEVASIPIQGTSCRFTTVYPVELHPLSLLDASYSQPPGRPATITLRMELTGMRPTDWRPETVRLFLSGEYGRAADLYLLLTRYLRRIIIESEDGSIPAVLDPSCLKPVGFDSGKGLFPASVQGAVSHDCVREFSILPEKFLFLDLNGWKNWRDRGEEGRFEVRFELERPPFALEKVTRGDFTLFAAPAVNVFPHKARPILFTGEDAEYPVIPEGGKSEHFAVYSIEKVTGISDGSAESVICAPNRSYADYSPFYRETRSESLHEYDTSISMKLPPQAVQRHIKTLVAELLCTNGRLAERLRIGDIRKETDKSPGYGTFTNCTPVTIPSFDSLGDNRLWRLFGMQLLNLKLLTAESLRSVLKLIYVSDGQDRRTVVHNERHIEGIQGLTIEARDRIVQQVMKRGWNIRIMLDPEYYCSPGGMYLFGVMLDHFLRGFVSEAYFSRTIIEDARSGLEYELPTKMGRRALV